MEVIHLFKNLKVTFWSLCLIGLILFVNSGTSITILNKQVISPLIPNVFLATALFVLYLFIIYYVIQNIANRKWRDIKSIYYDECDPQKFIDMMGDILKRCKNISLRTTFELMICSAHIELRNLDIAKQILDGNRYFSNNKAGLYNRISYYCNLFNYYVYSNDLIKAEFVLNDMNDFINHPPMTKHPTCKLFYTTYSIALDLRKGNFDGAEQFYRSKLDSAKDMFGRVSIHYTLGKIYFHYKKTKEAKEAFEYVVRYGNKLYKVKEAKDYLLQISSGVQGDGSL